MKKYKLRQLISEEIKHMFEKKKRQLVTEKFSQSRINENPLIGKVDHSTMRLKSNIDQKWSRTTDMVNDLTQWFQAATASGGPQLAKDIAKQLKGLAIDMEKEALRGGGTDVDFN